MSVLSLNGVVHLCEDTSQQFDLVTLLASAGYTAKLPMTISQMFVLDPVTGLPATGTPAGLFTEVDSDTVKVDASVYPDRNWTFNTLTIVIDAGPNQINLTIQVVVDPVNDAPVAEDHTIALGAATSYVVKVGDFGFSDPHDANPANQANPAGNSFMSVIVTNLPTSGSLLLNGVAVHASQEIGIADITAGHLVYQAALGVSGSTAYGFEVRDNGGLVGCGAADTSLVHHMTFTLPPPPSLGDFVWNDSNNNGIQDAGEAGISGVTLDLIAKGASATSMWQVLGQTTTDNQGYYHFNNLTAGVSYAVAIASPVTGYTLTQSNIGADDKDSDFLLKGSAFGLGQSQWVTLAAGQSDLTIDAGLVLTPPPSPPPSPPPVLGSVGDRVWYDGGLVTHDGIQYTAKVEDSNEGGNKVELYGAGADGKWNTGDDTYKVVTTDSQGAYLFTGLTAGLYQEKFTRAETFFKFVQEHAGNDAARDSDVDANGWTDVFSLAPGQNITTIDAGVWDPKASPIVLDLDGNGIHTTSLASSHGAFDLLGNGSPVQSGWLSSGDAFLAVDSNGNGKIDGLNELFGGDIGQGFAKLAAFDTNHDGVIDSKDQGYRTLLVWQDLNGDHQSSANELRTLAQAGIASLTVAHNEQWIAQGDNTLGETSSATKSDGSSITMTDVYFAVPGSADTSPAALAAVAPSAATIAKFSGMLQPANDSLDVVLTHGITPSAAVAPATAADHVSLNHDALSQLTALWAKAGMHALAA